MKKYIYALMTVSALGLASCDSQLDEPVSGGTKVPQLNEISVNLDLPADMRTRADDPQYDWFNAPNQVISWAAYDALGAVVAQGSEAKAATNISQLGFSMKLPLNSNLKLVVLLTKQVNGQVAYTLDAASKSIKLGSSLYGGGGPLVKNGSDYFNSTNAFSPSNVAFENMAKTGDCYYFFGDVTTSDSTSGQSVDIALIRPLCNIRFLSQDLEGDTNAYSSLSLMTDATKLTTEATPYAFPIAYNFWNDTCTYSYTSTPVLFNRVYECGVNGIVSQGRQTKYVGNFWFFAPKTADPKIASLYFRVVGSDNVTQNYESTSVKLIQENRYTHIGSSYTQSLVNVRVTPDTSFDLNKSEILPK